LELIDVQRNLVQGGSVVGTAQLAGGPHPASESVPQILDLEASRRLDKPETMKQFGAQLLQVKDRLAEMIGQFICQKKTIWGYGAARSATTFLAQMDLGKVIAAIVDDSPEKQGKFSPGDHIPILPTSALYEQRPDYTFLLAWIHAQRITENNQLYLRRGGHFILCFPEVEIIGNK
jgi:hypothetical protein